MRPINALGDFLQGEIAFMPKTPTSTSLSIMPLILRLDDPQRSPLGDVFCFVLHVNTIFVVILFMGVCVSRLVDLQTKPGLHLYQGLVWGRNHPHTTPQKPNDTEDSPALSDPKHQQAFNQARTQIRQFNLADDLLTLNSFRSTQTQLGLFSMFRSRRPDTCQVFCVSDLHLNYISGGYMANSQLGVLRLVNQTMRPATELLKTGRHEVHWVLNGDVMDLMCGWPWKYPSPDKVTPAQFEAQVKHTMDKIIEKNRPFFLALRDVLRSPQGRVFYILGNHDRWLSDPRLQGYLMDRMALTTIERERFKFCQRVIYPQMGFVALHGNEFDPNSKHLANPHQLNLLEKIELQIIHPIKYRIGPRLTEQGYAPAVVQKVQNLLEEIDNIRPPKQSIHYLHSKLSQLDALPEHRHIPKSIRRCLSDVSAESLVQNFPPPFGSILAWGSRLFWSGLQYSTFRNLVKQYVLTGYLLKAREDRAQLSFVKDFLATQDPAGQVRYVHLGHTHKPMSKSLIHPSTKNTVNVYNSGGLIPFIYIDGEKSTYPSGYTQVKWDTQRGTVSFLTQEPFFMTFNRSEK